MRPRRARPPAHTPEFESVIPLTYALIQLATVAFCLVLYRSIRQHAVWYYAGSIALVGLFFLGQFVALPGLISQPLFYLMQQCMLGMAFFVVVMFVGALPKTSKAGQKLRSIRGELSIIAWILCLGHLIYLAVIPRLVDIALRLGFAMPLTVIGLVTSVVLLVLLLVLGVTSFRFVKKHMSSKSWKAVQWWAYPFYALVYAHLLLMLAPAVSSGSVTPLVTAAVYTLIFGGYLVLRVRRAMLDRGMQAAAVGASAAA